MAEPPAVESQPESLDKVRDILFGSQMRAVETRLQGLEERLRREHESLRADFTRQVETLDALIRSESQSLTERARTSPASGTLFSALGGEELIVSLGLVDLEPGDVMLLCTDGLTGHVPDARIAEILGGAEDSASACRQLVDEALAGGGSDNITVVVARVQR